MPSEGLIHVNGENRRASKPLIEKRRRARINQSLAELKALVIDSKKDAQSQNARPPKLEKADILELTVAHVKELHDYLGYIPTENTDKSFKAGFAKCFEEIRQYFDREPNLTLTQKNKLLSHLLSVNSFSSSPELHGNLMDDGASSYSGNSSRSNTPSGTSDPLEISEYPTSMEYVSCSPFSDSNQGSSNSSSPSSNPRPSSCKSTTSAFSLNSSPRNNSSSLLQSSNSLPKRMEVALTLCNMNKPLNLASSSRTVDMNGGHGDGYFDNSRRNQTFNSEYDQNVHIRREVMRQNNAVSNGFVYRNDPEELENMDLLQMDPIWRPW